MKNENALVEFLLRNPMEMREFMESHNRLNFFRKWIIEFRAYWNI